MEHEEQLIQEIKEIGLLPLFYHDNAGAYQVFSN